MPRYRRRCNNDNNDVAGVSDRNEIVFNVDEVRIRADKVIVVSDNDKDHRDRRSDVAGDFDSGRHHHGKDDVESDFEQRRKGHFDDDDVAGDFEKGNRGKRRRNPWF